MIMGHLSKTDMSHIQKAPWCTMYKVPEIHKPVHISVDGKIKYSRLGREQAKMYWPGLNIFGKHVALMLDHDGHVIAHKRDSDYTYPKWWDQ